MTSLTHAPAKFTPTELADAGRRSDLLPLADPAGCSCNDCPACDDLAAAALADALGLDDAPDEADRDWYAQVRGVEYDRRQRQLAQYHQDGRWHAWGGCPLSIWIGLGDEQLADAFTQGWLEGAEALMEAAPCPEDLLNSAERMGWEGWPLSVPSGLQDHQAEEFAQAWAEGRRIRDRDEAELAAEGFGRRDLLA